ncbi:biotin--[acetyl-CoA-carboxylase] ligase [Oceanospirillum beijerinckii]|uniref:biotin--[acetyl-CoA-carboxylase] ligase n=1 Tax=Oceanospirillum beijerinckii TaxID=64976 RepID=UPI0003FB1DFA|nr:biotin--[acetyl-CoA-carboxylase] ligase [Oceanospirillum beijerinckii]MAC47998.1 biotin--[acetyl-CoA-carboxylase] ligase [Oceanospirillum sp.]
MEDIDLIRLLSDGESHSGVELAAKMGVSRAAVWKRLQKLESQGLPVVSEQGKGYKLAYPLSLLDPKAVKTDLAEGVTVDIKSITESTNNDVLQYIKDGSLDGSRVYVCLAEQQSAGRGRRGKEWQSPYGSNLYFSLGRHVALGAAALEGLSLSVGLLLARLLSKQGVEDVSVKWPNDIYIQGRKVAGILIEVDGDLTSYCNVVVGIGINFQLESLKDKWIDQAYTALDEYGVTDRSLIANQLIVGLQRVFNELEAGAAFDLSAWKAYDFLAGKAVDVHLGSQKVSGQAVGVDMGGNLLVRLEDGSERKFSGGEVSVRAQ